jgi:uncharacterized protein YutE (UPF0331/DUF86 family)
MEIDKDKIKKRFAEINDALREIERLSVLDDEEFWSRRENIAAVKYYLVQAIEAVGSVCVHVAARKLGKGVSAFGECFELMEHEKCLPGELAGKLRRMVKFRNKLIHQYWEISDKMVLEYCRENREDFKEFMAAIGGFVSE